MISKEEVEKLAELARLQLGEGEVESLQKDISGILDYVGQVSAVSLQGEVQGDTLAAGLSKEPPLPRNVMRDDVPYDNGLSGKHEALLDAFPKREGDYLVVRKIIQKDE